VIGRALTVALVAASACADVSFDRIRSADAEPGNWLTYSRTYSGQRFTTLAQINTGNVDQLRPVWVHQPQQSGKFETSPIVNQWAKTEGVPMWRRLTSLPPARIVQCIDFHHLRDVLTEDELLEMLESRAAQKEQNLVRLQTEGPRVYSTAGWSGRPLEEVRAL
jgi:hypothetical protein